MNYLNLFEEIPAENSSFISLLSDRVNGQPDQTVYTFLHRGETEVAKLTYRDLDIKARAIASLLQSCQAQGERALLLYPPGLDFITAFLGCLYASVVAVPAYPPRPNQKLTRLEGIITDASPKVVLTTSSLLDTIKRRFSHDSKIEIKHWLTSDNLNSKIASDWQRPKLDGNTLAFLQYTSGSTGTPKGVMITHGNLLHNSSLIYNNFGHSSQSVGVIWLPPYHDMGLIGGILQPLYGGFPVILMSPVDFLQKPLRWLKAISHYRATTSGGPNFAYELVCQKVTEEQIASLDLSSWELAFTGAEPVRAGTLNKFADTFKPAGFKSSAFYPCYGMAETTLIVTGGQKSAEPIVEQVDKVALEQNQIVTIQDEKNCRQIVGCGKVLSELKIRIVDPQSLKELPANQVGEIWISGPSVARGYWDQSGTVQGAFNGYLVDTGEGPFLRTGDLGFVKDGELFITGRIKDTIIIRGQNYYPHDIELTVENSHPALQHNGGAAFAIDINDQEKLVIVQEVKRTYLRNLDVQQIVADIRQAVTTEHNLQVYAIALVKTGGIPKTSSGKIQHHACKTAFLSGSLNVVNDWSENPRGKTKFLRLQADVDEILEKLQMDKQLN